MGPEESAKLLLVMRTDAVNVCPGGILHREILVLQQSFMRIHPVWPWSTTSVLTETHPWYPKPAVEIALSTMVAGACHEVLLSDGSSTAGTHLECL